MARPGKRMEMSTYACPKCRQNTEVIDTRTQASRTVVVRRRRCTACNFRINTVEFSLDYIPVDADNKLNTITSRWVRKRAADILRDLVAQLDRTPAGQQLD